MQSNVWQGCVRSFRCLPRYYGTKVSSITSVNDSNTVEGSQSISGSKDHKTAPSLVGGSLYMEPKKWIGKEPQQILDLYWERMVKLGKRYQRSPEELEALLSTSDHTGVSKRDIRILYERGERGLVDTSEPPRRPLNGLRPFEFDELPSAAQDLVAQHREQRHFSRLAAYELPLLVRHRKPYKPVDRKTHPISLRFTTYVGEDHPNSRKVTMQCKVSDLPLDDRQAHKFKLLARTNYDHVTDIFKKSCEKFEEAQQNASYLRDVLQRLLKESHDLADDDFSDVPLDTRHTTAKYLRKKRKNFEFPEHWKRPQDAPQPTINLFRELNSQLAKQSEN